MKTHYSNIYSTTVKNSYHHISNLLTKTKNSLSTIPYSPFSTDSSPTLPTNNDYSVKIISLSIIKYETFFIVKKKIRLNDFSSFFLYDEMFGYRRARSCFKVISTLGLMGLPEGMRSFYQRFIGL